MERSPEKLHHVLVAHVIYFQDMTVTYIINPQDMTVKYYNIYIFHSSYSRRNAVC